MRRDVANYGSEIEATDELKDSAELRAYTDRLRVVLSSAHKSVRDNLDIAQQNQKILYDMHRKKVEFEVGDLVLTANTAGSALGKWAVPKLAPK
ncbi:unnamed protein product [Didymodactylos carnosus]|uniref:Uncharacterized protein n=1 Tax=Didymodactylos carnosus TaxID=1234261 RepID=A0A814IQR3_9BILA|nr:unnamed protein product [Didymodactylos carnosus]CAF3797857.1 unnamed protein product [Didymodactylos carnosus]